MKKIVSIGPIRERISPRPGAFEGSVRHMVPDPEHKDFWDFVATYITERAAIVCPVNLGDRSCVVNHFFGSFGHRFHPILRRSESFHLGLDITAPPKTPVIPMIDGVLEYAGFSLQNGHYVMLSHPQIITDDGFTLFTLYIHLRDVSIGFTRYQKMLREISLRTHPQIPVTTDTVIGTVGDSGNVAGMHTHLHLQCEFRHPDGTIVAINPAQLLGLEVRENITAGIGSEDEFMDFYHQQKDDIHRARIEGYWQV